MVEGHSIFNGFLDKVQLKELNIKLINIINDSLIKPITIPLNLLLLL